MNSILTIIKFDKNFEIYIPPLILLIPRTSLLLCLFAHIHEKIFKNKLINENKNLKLICQNKEKEKDFQKEMQWFLPIGVYFDIITKNNQYAKMELELLCCENNNKSFFDVPIKNINLMTQQRLKHGLGTIFNCVRIFVELPVQEIENYVSFALSTNYNYKTQKNFIEFLNKIYEKKTTQMRIPLIFHYQSKMHFFAPLIPLILINNNLCTLKEIIWKSGFSTEILNNNKIFINGYDLKNLENVPILFSVKNLCSSDLFVHCVIV